MSVECDAVVVGAGVAGLTAAKHITAAGRDVVVLEQASAPGGRIRTDRVDGFLLDRGFQLLNPAYPAAQRNLDLAALQLQSFPKGARIGVPATVLSLSAFSPQSWYRLARGKVASVRGLSALVRYALRCGWSEPARLRQRPDLPLGATLREHGVDDATLTEVAYPFLAGVFGQDDPGAVSRNYADFVLRSFVRGRPAVPSQGMQAIPDQLASSSAGALRYDSPVRRLTSQGVHTDDEEFRCRAVVLATDAASATALLPSLRPRPMNDLTTWYFTSDTEVPCRELIVAPADSMLCNIAVMTNTAPTYSADGRALIAASAVGLWPTGEAAELAREQTAVLLDLAANELAEIARYPIPGALPRFDSPRPSADPLRNPLLHNGVYVIGDHQDTPSIQGAMVSGERGAAAVLAALG